MTQLTYCEVPSVLSQSKLMQEQRDMADVEAGKPSCHDSGSSLSHLPNSNGHLRDDPAAAKCWDIAASDIVICKRSDRSNWLLSSSDSGQVQSPASCHCSVEWREVA